MSTQMKAPGLVRATALALAAIMTLAPALANAQLKQQQQGRSNPFRNIPIAAESLTINGVPTAGTLDITNFRAVSQGGGQSRVYAIGVINTATHGAVPVALPIVGEGASAGPRAQLGSCEILDLHIGAIELDLLGLVIEIAPIDIEITAERGPGNLLGNLLCAVVGLLDGLDLGGLLEDLLAAILEGLLNEILNAFP